MGRVHAVTNAEEVAAEMQNTGVGEDRWQEVIQDEDNNRKVVSKAVLIGLAKSLAKQGRVSPGSVGITAMQDMMAVTIEWFGKKDVYYDNISG